VSEVQSGCCLVATKLHTYTNTVPYRTWTTSYRDMWACPFNTHILPHCLGTHSWTNTINSHLLPPPPPHTHTPNKLATTNLPVSQSQANSWTPFTWWQSVVCSTRYHSCHLTPASTATPPPSTHTRRQIPTHPPLRHCLYTPTPKPTPLTACGCPFLQKPSATQ